MKKSVFFGLTWILLVLSAWLFIGSLWDSVNPNSAINLAIGLFLFASALGLAINSIKSGVGMVMGLLILAGLFLPNAGFVASPSFYLPLSFQNLFQTLVFIMPSLALVMTALLLYSGINQYKAWRGTNNSDVAGHTEQRKIAGRTALAHLALGMVLLARTLYNLYWLSLWDQTNDSLGYLLLAVPVFVVIFSGLMLSIKLDARVKLTGLFYGVFVMYLMIAVSGLAQNVDFYQLTEARARQVTQAIETFYVREGQYPQNLQQLTPWIMLSIPEPVIIYGQGWCYQGGGDDYSLGYITREHWSSPILTEQVYKTEGQASNLSHLCDAEFEVIRRNYPESKWQYVVSRE